MSVAVRFVQPFRGYSAGEVAGFPPDQSERLVTSGFAEYLETPERTAVAPEDSETATMPRPRGPRSMLRPSQNLSE